MIPFFLRTFLVIELIFVIVSACISISIDIILLRALVDEHYEKTVEHFVETFCSICDFNKTIFFSIPK